MPVLHRSLIVLAILSVSTMTAWPDTFSVTNNANAGPGTLRQAILDANGSPGADVVLFNLDPADFTITISNTALTVNGPLHIDGTSATNYSGIPLIEVKAGNTNLSGISTISGSVTCDALRVTGFRYGFNIASPRSRIRGCYALSNWQSGILISASNCVVGGATSGDRNTVSANGSGVTLAAPGAQRCVIANNYIGVDPSGTAALGNEDEGIGLYASHCFIGGSNTLERNIISGNDVGVLIGASAVQCVIQNCFMGTDAGGYSSIPNNLGMDIYGVSNTVGGLSTQARNVIAGNSGDGVFFRPHSGFNIVQGNFIGVAAGGATPLGNHSGIELDRSAYNVIGSSNASGRNVISGNRYYGISVHGTGSVMTAILGNYIGVDHTGFGAVTNARDGINIYDAVNTQVGGGAPGEGNLLSGNYNAIKLAGTNGWGAIIRGNLIGTDAAGTGRMGNAQGIHVDNLPFVTIGGSSAGDRNVVSGNRAHGIFLQNRGCHDTSILGNYIGTDSSGSIPMSNKFTGIFIESAPSNIIGTVSAGNLISGNGQEGLRISGALSVGNVVRGNFIGTDVTGTLPVGNRRNGIEASCRACIFGGGTAGEGNLISGNRASGIYLYSSNAVDNVFEGNTIGSDVNGSNALPNLEFGMYFANFARSNTVGGLISGDENLIAYNTLDGIYIATNVAGVRILGNSFTANGQLAIDLAPNGVGINDATDPDVGSNNQQNYPVITRATNLLTDIEVHGTLNSRPNRSYSLLFFGDYGPDQSGHGEGLVYLGSHDIATDSSGNASYTNTMSNPAPTPDYVSAIAVDKASWDSSEMSAASHIDSDGDCIPDGWEEEYFGSPNGSDPEDDPDGDGMSNCQEWIADTNPTNGLSYLRIVNITHTGTVTVAVDTSPYRFYVARRAGNLNNPAWDNNVSVEKSGTGGRIYLTDITLGETNAAFYRVRARLP
ncbi:MAG: hypothetical protein KJ626_10995 [Verrucomicrobia bacterium]|nr:hypothetical protein [Verrucomicrobiota bacterium]